MYKSVLEVTVKQMYVIVKVLKMMKLLEKLNRTQCKTHSP